MVDFLIVANSGRSLAASATQAGYKVCIADYFVDEDTKSFSESVHQLQYSDDGFNLEELLSHVAEIISRYPEIKLVAGSGFELNPELIEKLDKLLTVFGNSKNTIESLKQPINFFRILDKHSILYPEVSFSRPKTPEQYLKKGVASIGGSDVNWADKTNQDLKSECYYQQYISGQVSSAVFLANGNSAKIIGFNRQLQSKEFTDMPFLYQGAISLNKGKVEEKERIEVIVNDITQETDLKGLCGIDYVLDDENNVYVLEVNPRPPGTFELHERQASLFDAHLACFDGKFLEGNSCDDDENRLKGYAILYAKEKLFISDKIKWPNWVKDRPVANNVVETTIPVCTVHAEENSIDKVKTMLFNRLKKMESITAATQNAAQL